MRIEHLADDEIQAYVDSERRGSAESENSVGQHLKSCAQCRERVEQYRVLFEQLADSDELHLPAGFARKVTLSLPPFAAKQRRSRIRAALGAGLLPFMTIVSLLMLIDWGAVGRTLSVAFTSVYPVVIDWWLTVVLVIAKGLTVSEITIFQWLWPESVRLNSLVNSVCSAFASNSTTVTFLICAGFIALLLTSLDNPVFLPHRRQRQS